MNPCRPSGPAYSLSRNMCLLRDPVNGGGVEISFGVLGSSLPDLEEEGLEGGVSPPDVSSPGR